MAVKPILFSGPMVRAIIEDRKNVTRRAIKPIPSLVGFVHVENREMVPYGERRYTGWCAEVGQLALLLPREPRYRKGDVLYVKEAWRVTEEYDHLPPRDIPRDAVIEYLATDVPFVLGRYRHARFMREWMTRLWVRVTEEPTPERVRDITEAEAIREGVERFTSPIGVQGWKPYREGALDVLQFPQNSFQTLWESIHGPDSWERDWVWRYAFKRTEAPDA